MKKVLLTALAFMLLAAAALAQVPQGMKYQAVARDLKGNILAEQEIALRIGLVGNDKGTTTYYQETHNVTTNELGLFTLVIGEGKVEKGNFSSAPWSTEEI